MSDMMNYDLHKSRINISPLTTPEKHFYLYTCMLNNKNNTDLISNGFFYL